MRYYAFPCNAVREPEHLTVNQGVVQLGEPIKASHTFEVLFVA